MDSAAITSSPSQLRSSSSGRPVGHKRAPVACINCRNRKVRCDTTDSERMGRCKRCAEQNFECEFLTVADEQERKSRASSTVPGDLEPQQELSYPMHSPTRIGMPHIQAYSYSEASPPLHVSSTTSFVQPQHPSTNAYHFQLQSQFHASMGHGSNSLQGGPQGSNSVHGVGPFVQQAPFNSSYTVTPPHGNTYSNIPPLGIGAHPYYDPNALMDSRNLNYTTNEGTGEDNYRQFQG